MSQKSPNPWLGLRSYQEGETIYGRSDEIQTLAQCILSNVQTVVYGKSGIGKTSILNAGVFPIVRKKGVFPIYLRLVHNSGPYFKQISDALFLALNKLKKNGYNENGDETIIFEAGTYKELTKPIRKDRESLWEFLHRYEFYDASGNKIKPLLVFDQFEEIFTIEKDRLKVRRFFDELADVLNGVVPDYINNAVDVCQTANDSAESSDELSFELSDFNFANGQYENYLASSDFHIVFTLREDFLSYLERETFRIPSLRQNKYCLQAINEEQASIIIMNPLPGLVSKEVAKLIIQKVTGETAFELDGTPEISVDSSILSLYLSCLYDSLDSEDTEFSSTLVEKEAENIIHDFYSDSIKDIPSEIVEYLEDNLVNGEGRRESISTYNAKHDGKIKPEILSKLVNERKLLRQLDYGGNLRLELIHDILCPVVTNRKIQRQMLKEQEEAERQNKIEANRLKLEKEAIIRDKARSRKISTVLAIAAVVLCAFAMVIITMGIKNRNQSARLDELNNKINGILPSIIEQKINDGDIYSAESFLVDLFPDCLYKAGDAQRITLLRKLSCTSAQIFEGHSQSVNAVAFSKDGKFAVSGSDDMTIKIWDTKTEQIMSTFGGNNSEVTSLSISSSCNMIAMATKDGMIRLLSSENCWNQVSQQAIPGSSYPRFITFGPNDNHIYACCVDGQVYIFDSNNLELVDSFKTTNKGGTYISFDPAGTRMALAGSDNAIHIYNVNDNSIISTFSDHKDWVRSVEFSPDGKYLVSTSDDKTVRIWSIASHSSQILTVLPAWGTKADFTPNGKMIVISSKDGVMRFFDADSKCEIPEYQIQHSGSINSFDISSDGRRIITCSTEPTIHIWDCGDIFDTGTSMSIGKGNAIYGLAYIPNTFRIAMASQNGILCVWDVNTGEMIYKVGIGDGDNGRANSLDVSPDGKYIAVSTKFNVRLFDAATGKEIQMDNTNGHRGWVRDICFSHDGQYIASVGEDMKIILWDVAKKTIAKRMDGQNAGIYSVDFSHDDKRLVTGAADATICQWNVNTGDLIGYPFHGHKKVITAVRYSLDDSKILSASGDQTACIWTADGEIVQQFIGASGYINDAIWGQSEDEIITASTDKYVRIWCALNGEETARMAGHFGGISHISLSKDGVKLVSSDYIGGVKVWAIPKLETIAQSWNDK